MRVAACGGTLPFDVAFSADDSFVMAWVVAAGENDGSQFDWQAMKWRERSK
jgi:hypothetical protein